MKRKSKELHFCFKLIFPDAVFSDNIKYGYTVELRRLEPLWDHENLFEIWVVRAIEG